MNGRTHPDCDHPRTTAFLLWGWALLLLVLLSAAPTAAQPVARLVGSAFDPSTMSVTVGPNRRDENVWIKKLRSNDPDADAPDLSSRPPLIAAVRATGSGSAIAPQVPFDRAPRSDIPLRASVRSQPARAPPLG